MTDEELSELLAKAREERAYLAGRIEALRDEALRDRSLHETLRVREWVKAGAKVAYDRAADRFDGVPDGWPEGIDDGDAFAREYVDGLFQVETDERGPALSESVAAFRKAIGEGS